MCLSGQLVLKVRLAASSMWDGNEWAWAAVPIASKTELWYDYLLISGVLSRIHGTLPSAPSWSLSSGSLFIGGGACTSGFLTALRAGPSFSWGVTSRPARSAVPFKGRDPHR